MFFSRISTFFPSLLFNKFFKRSAAVKELEPEPLLASRPLFRLSAVLPLHPQKRPPHCPFHTHRCNSKCESLYRCMKLVVLRPTRYMLESFRFLPSLLPNPFCSFALSLSIHRSLISCIVPNLARPSSSFLCLFQVVSFFSGRAAKPSVSATIPIPFLTGLCPFSAAWTRFFFQASDSTLPTTHYFSLKKFPSPSRIVEPGVSCSLQFLGWAWVRSLFCHFDKCLSARPRAVRPTNQRYPTPGRPWGLVSLNDSMG